MLVAVTATAPAGAADGDGRAGQEIAPADGDRRPARDRPEAGRHCGDQRCRLVGVGAGVRWLGIGIGDHHRPSAGHAARRGAGDGGGGDPGNRAGGIAADRDRRTGLEGAAGDGDRRPSRQGTTDRRHRGDRRRRGVGVGDGAVRDLSVGIGDHHRGGTGHATRGSRRGAGDGGGGDPGNRAGGIAADRDRRTGLEGAAGDGDRRPSRQGTADRRHRGDRRRRGVGVGDGAVRDLGVGVGDHHRGGGTGRAARGGGCGAGDGRGRRPRQPSRRASAAWSRSPSVAVGRRIGAPAPRRADEEEPQEEGGQVKIIEDRAKGLGRRPGARRIPADLGSLRGVGAGVEHRDRRGRRVHRPRLSDDEVLKLNKEDQSPPSTGLAPSAGAAGGVLRRGWIAAARCRSRKYAWGLRQRQARRRPADRRAFEIGQGSSWWPGPGEHRGSNDGMAGRRVQQGRDLDHRAGRTSPSSPMAGSSGRRCSGEPARRALAHERRPGAGAARRLGVETRIDARPRCSTAPARTRSARCWSKPSCRSKARSASLRWPHRRAGCTRRPPSACSTCSSSTIVVEDKNDMPAHRLYLFADSTNGRSTTDAGSSTAFGEMEVWAFRGLWRGACAAGSDRQVRTMSTAAPASTSRWSRAMSSATCPAPGEWRSR